MAGSGITRGEMRGLLVLAAVLTAIVGFTAWFGGKGDSSQGIPVEIQAKIDSIATVDSLRKVAEDDNVVDDKVKRRSLRERKKRTPVADRMSPLDREVH